MYKETSFSTQGLVLAPFKLGYTFLVLPLSAGPILAPIRIPLEPLLDLYSLIHVVLIRLSGLASLFHNASLTSIGRFQYFGSTKFTPLCFLIS